MCATKKSLDDDDKNRDHTKTMDVCLILGRWMRVGMTANDQMPPAEERGCFNKDYLTFWMRATIARPWHDLTKTQLAETRDALNTLIRRDPWPSRDERKGGFLSLSTVLSRLLEGCRSVSWTQKGGHQCIGCKRNTYNKDPAWRVIHALGLTRTVHEHLLKYVDRRGYEHGLTFGAQDNAWQMC